MKTSRLLKAALFLTVVGVAIYLATPAQAYHQNPQRKFGRGAGNTLFGWTEVPQQVLKEQQENGPAAAVTFGLVKGVTQGVGRTVVGVWEMITFPFPNGGGRGYDPIFRPEFPLGDFNETIIPFFGDGN